MRYTVQLMRGALPGIPWHEPIKVTHVESATTHYACRICIAQHGLRDEDVARLPTNPQTVRTHILTEHSSQHD